MRTFFNIWVLGTLALFYLGPVPWPGRESPLVALLVLTCLLAFNVGAIGGARLPALPASARPVTGTQLGRNAVVLLWIGLSALHVLGSTGLNIFNPADYSFDFGEIYDAYQEGAQRRALFGSRSLLTMVIMLKALIFIPVLCLLAQDFRRRPLQAALILFPFVGSSMMRGTDKEFADILIIVMMLCYYHRMMNRRLLFIAALAVVVVAFFFERKMARFDHVLPACLPRSIVCFDYDSWVATTISPSAEIILVFLANYLTQGYQAMSMAFELPFEFNWGIGHLPPLKERLCETFRIGCDLGDFQDKLFQAGWDTRYRWTGAYTVIANDTHWTFVPGYFFVMGAIFGISEKSWRASRDSHSLAALLLISLFMVYASANMQIAISMDWVVVTLAILGGQILRIGLHATRRAEAVAG